ncbi:MAG: putative transcriptional regulator, TetR family protein [Solirubrobacterales bacterium]|nr:putative transcriptional regulator, TetR family protein [Solirubrobacterales bacterium]
MASTKNDSSSPDTGGRKRTGLRRALVEKEILDRAAELFAERGFTGTSLQDVAEALGMSRTALYYYMSSKEAILGRLVENLSARNAKTLETVRRRKAATPAQKLREMAHEIAHTAGSNPEQTRILTENRHHLPPDLGETDRVAERSILRSFEIVINEGVQAGVFRAVEPRPAALSIIGMCVWTAWWVSVEERQSIDVIAAQIADQALASVAVAADDSDRATPAGLLRSLRENLEQLERVIAE